MTQKIKVPDMAYSIDCDIVEIEQDMGHGEYALIELHKIHIKLIAEEMNLIEPDNTARMGEVVKAELMELLEAIGEHWEDLGNSRGVDINCLVQAKALNQRAQSICRIAGCNLDDEPSVTSALPVASNAQASLLEAQS